MKNILVIHYSQTGQLTRILNSIMSGLNQAEYHIEYMDICPKTPYKFPWTKDRFYNEMPNSVNGRVVELVPMHPKLEKYDLIVLGYQVWFLSPSVPVNSFLQTETAAQIFKNTPVITVLGVRNMWVMAQERVKKRLSDLGANLVGNIVLEDPHHNMVSVITIIHWLMRGKTDRYLGIFPVPGVGEDNIQKASRFGKVIQGAFQQSEFSSLQKQLVEQGAVKLKANLVFVEGRGTMLFKIWANLIEKRGTTPEKRRKLLRIFSVYLIVAIFLIAPIVLLLFSIFRLVLYRKINKQLTYYRGVD